MKEKKMMKKEACVFYLSIYRAYSSRVPWSHPIVFKRFNPRVCLRVRELMFDKCARLSWLISHGDWAMSTSLPFSPAPVFNLWPLALIRYYPFSSVVRSSRPLFSRSSNQITPCHETSQSEGYTRRRHISLSVSPLTPLLCHQLFLVFNGLGRASLSRKAPFITIVIKLE